MSEDALPTQDGGDRSRHLRKVYRVVPFTDTGRVPGADGVVRTPDEDVLLLWRSAQIAGEPHRERWEEREVPGGVPGLEAEVLAEHVPHVV